MRIIIIISIIFLIAGCGKESKPKTIENLEAAYMDEISDSKTYSLYADKAMKEGYVDIANQLREFSKIEYTHAMGYLSLLKIIGYNIQDLDENESTINGLTWDNINQLISNETHDVMVMYRDFMKIAKNENQHEAYTAFQQASKADQDKLLHFKTQLGNPIPWKKKKNLTFGTEYKF
jgi:rubrerythrin